MSVNKIFICFILLMNIYNISSLKYPIYNNIDKSETNKVKSIIINSKDQYIDYILNSNYAISLIYFSPFEQFSKIINIFDKASSYKILDKWVFLKVQCSQPNEICQIFENNDKSVPTLKIYINSVDQKKINLPINFELNEILELLIKYSTNPIIEINSDDKLKEFYDKYGTFSPKVIYDKEHTEFISCINMLAKKKYLNLFYFGILEKKKEQKEEKIIFDNDNYPIAMTWEGECDDIDTFLSQNIYQLINEVDNPLISQLNNIPKILVILIGNISKNQKIKLFIDNYYKKISYTNRKYVFGYIDYMKDKNFTNKYKINIKNDNEISLMIYNFYENIYHIHPYIYDISSQKEKEIYNDINDIVIDIFLLSYTTGSIFKDLIRKLGLHKMIDINDKKQLNALYFTIFVIVAGFLYLNVFNSSNTSNKNKSKKE